MVIGSLSRGSKKKVFLQHSCRVYLHVFPRAASQPAFFRGSATGKVRVLGMIKLGGRPWKPSGRYNSEVLGVGEGCILGFREGFSLKLQWGSTNFDYIPFGNH